MYIFDKEIQAAKAQTMTGSTMTVSLDEKVDYTALLLRFSWTADSSQIDATKERILDWVTGITVVGDDDKYVKNISAREAAALHFYRTKNPVNEFLDNTDGSINTLELPILMGRYFGDPEYFLKKNQFSKLELNVTNGDSDTGNYFDAGTLEVRGHIFKDHPIESKGVIRDKQVKSWVPSSATDSWSEELPDKNLIEKILVEGQPTYTARTAALTAELTTLIDKLKLTFKGGDIVVFDDDIEDLFRRNAGAYGLARTGGYLTGKHADYVDVGLGYVQKANATVAASVTAGRGEIGFTNARLQKQLLAQIAAADVALVWNALGYAYLDTVIFDFARDREFAFLYDPTAYAKGELKVTAGSTAGIINIAVSEIVKAF